MKNLTKLFLGAVGMAGVVTAAAPAFAQDAPAWALAGSLAVTSDYRFRGISQNDREFTPQGSLTLTAPEGFYASIWMSQVDFNPLPGADDHAPDFEIDIYGGKHTDLWGVDWNFMPYYYAYTNDLVPGMTFNYFELINQFSKSFGPVSFTGSWAWSDNLPLNGGTGNALWGTVSYPILDWLSISGTIGHQWAQNAKYAGSRDYTYGDVGLSASWKGFVLDARYVGNDLTNAQCGAFYMATNNACGDTFVATLTYNISILP